MVGDLKESFSGLDRAFEVYHSLDKESQENCGLLWRWHLIARVMRVMSLGLSVPRRLRKRNIIIGL